MFHRNQIINEDFGNFSGKEPHTQIFPSFILIFNHLKIMSKKIKKCCATLLKFEFFFFSFFLYGMFPLQVWYNYIVWHLIHHTLQQYDTSIFLCGLAQFCIMEVRLRAAFKSFRAALNRISIMQNYASHTEKNTGAKMVHLSDFSYTYVKI